jgi:hypothetical protein
MSWKLNRSAETEFLADFTFQHKSGVWQNFAMASPETLNTKFPSDELNFPLLTHMVNSDLQFGSYRLLKSGQGAENFLDRLIIQVNGHVLGHKKRKSC